MNAVAESPHAVPLGYRSATGLTVFSLAAIGVALCLWPLSLPSFQRDVLLLAEAGVLLALGALAFGHAWALVLFVLPFLPLYPSFFGQTKLTVLRVLLVLLAMALATTRLSRFLSVAGRSSFVLWAAVAYGGANLLSACAADSMQSVGRAFTYFEPALFFAISYLVVFFKPRRVRTLVGAVCLSGVFVLLLATLEVVTQQPLTTLLGSPTEDIARLAWMKDNRFGLGGRVTSTIGQPVYAGIFVCLWLAVCLPQLWTRGRLVIVSGLALAWGTLVLFATAARGPILVAALLIVSLALWRSRIAFRAAVAVLIVGGGLWVQVAGLPRVAQHFRSALSLEPRQEEAANLIGRADVTRRMLSIFRENPWLGIGPGYIQHAAEAGDPQFVGLGGLENTYAVVAADTGAAGLVTYVVFVIATIAVAAGAFLRARSREARSVAGALLWFFVFQSLVAISVFCPTGLNANLSLALLGAVVAATRAIDGGDESSPAPIVASV